MAKHRLHHRLAQGIDRLACFGSELAIHPAAGIKAFLWSAP
jgi:hypothetical protein